MGLRIAAGLTAAVIAIAVVAAFIAAHRGPVGYAPADQDPNVKAYREMISSDYNTMDAATSSHCYAIQDTGCQAALNVLMPTLQKWVGDLDAFHTPSRFSVIDGQLRAHLNEVTAEANAAVAFQKAGNENGFNLAMNAAYYERAWIDPATMAIQGTYPTVAGTYRDAIRLARRSLDGCVHGTLGPGDFACSRLLANRTCTIGSAPGCEIDVQSADTQLQTFLIGLLENPAPSALSTRNAQLQAELAQADTALLAITDAMLRGDSVNVDAGQQSFYRAILAAQLDASYLASS